MTSDEMRDAVRSAVRLKLRYLRPTKWRKGLTLEDVLRDHGPDVFADAVADQIALANGWLFQGPPREWHGSAGVTSSN